MADGLYAEAEKKINKFFFKDYESAQELFSKAGARYKLEKNYVRAGDAYSRAGDCAVYVKDKFSAAHLYADSANAYKKVDVKKASEMLNIATKMMMDNNQLAAAAKLVKEYADALDESGAAMESIPYYEKAMQYFTAEDQHAQAQKCMVAMAKIYGEQHKFDEALKYYERIANTMRDGPLKYQAQEYYLRAMLCRFAMVTNDNRFERSSECREALENYYSLDPYLSGTRESEFLDLILDAVENSNVDKFEEGVSLLHGLKKLDEWKTHVLLVVKQNMDSLL